MSGLVNFVVGLALGYLACRFGLVSKVVERVKRLIGR